MAKINQKYFGNRNIGTGGVNTSDDKIGGEGIASVNWSNLGLFRGNDPTNSPLVGLAPPAPTLPGGVQATWTVTFEVASVSTGSGKAGLVVGDTYTYAAGGSPTITVATISGTNATFTTTAGSGLAYGSLPTDTTGVNITKVTGSGPAIFLTDINFKVKSVTISEKGSGYTGAETFTVTTYSATTGAAPAGTIVLTTDSGAPGSNTNQENAIIAYAKTTSGGTSQPADIIKQRSTKRFKVTTTDGTAICKLVVPTAPATSITPAFGEMTIVATDDTNGTYYVTKIGAHKCTITRGNGTAFATNSSVPWVFSKSAPAYDAATTVVISNA